MKGWEKEILASWRPLCDGLGFEPGLILVNDGSSSNISDREIQFLQNAIPSLQYLVYHPNRGKGYALREGVSASTANCCIYTDVDFPYQTESILKVAGALGFVSATGSNVGNLDAADPADVVAGVKDAAYYSQVPPMRQRISRLLRWLIGQTFRMKITDTQCGLKGFNRKGRAVFLNCSIERYLFDLEFLYLASREADLKLTPVEISLKPGVVFSKMRFGILVEEGLNFLKVLFRR